MTNQEAFDQIVAHLRTQGSKSTRIIKCWEREQVEFALRGDDGKKDPAGLLIDDADYNDKEMEGWTFSSIIAHKDTPQSLKDKFLEHPDQCFLINALCYVHDYSKIEE